MLNQLQRTIFPCKRGKYNRLLHTVHRAVHFQFNHTLTRALTRARTRAIISASAKCS